MTHARSKAVPLNGSSDETESAFYEALRRGDIERLMACWSDDDDIAYVRPSGTRLLGAGAIRDEFTAVFAKSPVYLRRMQVNRVLTLSSAVHSVVEQLRLKKPNPRLAVLLVTTVYHKTPQGWRMVVRHSSPGRLPTPVIDGPRPVLH